MALKSTDIMSRFPELSAEKQKLLAELLEREVLTQTAKTTIPRRGSQSASLSYAQQRLWFLHEFEEEKSLYNVPLVVRIRGELQADILERAIKEIVRRHEVLRTGFAMVDGSPVQVIAPEATVNLERIDLRGLETEDRRAAKNRIIDERARGVFDLGSGPLLRVTLAQVEDREYFLVVVLHHIVSDGWSMSVFTRELTALYEGCREGRESPLAEPAIQYADYAMWQRQWLLEEPQREKMEYWRKQLQGVPELLELSVAKARPPVPSHAGAEWRFEWGPELTGGLLELGREQGATLFMVVLAGFAVLLHRYSGQPDVVVGSPIAGRNRKETEALIGFFVNTLVLRTNLGGHPTVSDLLRQVKDMALAAYGNQDTPFEKLVEELQPERDLGRNPLFQVMFGLQNTPEAAWRLPGLELTEELAEVTTAKFDLALYFLESHGRLAGSWVYRTDLFEEDAIRRMSEHLRQLLSGMAGHGERRVEELVMPGKEERRMLVEEWNNTKWDAGEGRGAETLVHLFEEQLKLTPAAVAVEQDGRHISYAELHRRANQLAHKLREAGVGSEVTVGLCLERTAEMVIAVLAILKAGGAYVPLDPGYPTQRLNYMLRDSGVTVLLSQSSLRNIEWAEERTIRVDIDAQAEPAGKARQQAPWTGVEPENAAYVIYTSGSTGRPKGVVVRHRSAAELAKWARRQYASEDLNGVLFGTSVCFDLSVFEMLVPLTAGGRVVIAENPLSLGQMAERGGVRLLNTVPSVIGELTRTTGIPAGVRTVNIAGEALKRTLVKRIYEQSGVERVVNLYGPTEDTTYSTFAVLRREDEGEVPIGRPVSNSQVYVLDEGMQPQPVSVAGEIYLGGEGLARGYCNQPGLTAERFVPDRLSGETGRRLYRTGDRGRWRADGQLEFLGRADRQVKLRGYRIEPGEIEAALSGHEAVSECAVLVAGQEAEKRQLVAFLVTRKSVKPPDVNELRRYLSTLLPEYMLPSVYSEVQALPLSSSGKLDRRALLNIHSSMNRPGPAQETNEVLLLHGDSTELYLKTLWEEILGISGVKSTDNFFAIGGHSLAAFAIAFRLAEYYKQPIPVRAVFQYPTISEISAFLRQAVMLSPPTSVIPINPGGELRPVFFIHPGGGWVNCYAPMARFLGTDRPIYGVQSYGFDEGQVPFRRIADMAAQYILDIEAIQPKGPYQIGGWCFGGTVAYEMARQWSRKGEVVSLLAIFDEVPISEPLKSGVSDQEIEAIEVDYLRSIAKELFPREFRISGVRVPAEQTLPAEEQLGVVMRRLKETGVLPRDITEQQYRRYLRVFASNMAAKNRYCCESFPGRITLFRSISGDLSSADRHDETGGWGRWARAGVDVHRCEMYHHDFVVREDNARELAEILQRCIENA